jgi:hypothetical protein
MDMKEKTFRLSLPDLDTLLHNVVREIGYDSEEQAGEDMVGKIVTACEDALRLSRPAYVFDKTSLHSLEKGIIRGEDVSIGSVNWAKLVSSMDDPGIIYFFAVTIGEDIDREISIHQDDFMLHAYLMDVAGSVLAEHCADEVNGYLSDILDKNGYETTARFSPGYCDWELKDGQTNLFKFLNTDSIGLRINSSGLMIPRKSVSAALIGARKIPYTTPCRFCKNICEYRR